MLEPLLCRLERDRHVEDRLAVLLCNDAPGRERAPVADTIDMIDDGHRRIAFAQEVPVQRMCGAAFDRPACRNERLRGHEAAENSRAAIVGAESTKEIGIERLQVEPLEKAVEVGHPGELARDLRGRGWGRLRGLVQIAHTLWDANPF